MYKNLKSLVLCALLAGIFLPVVFGVDLSKSLSQEAQNTFSSQDIFGGGLIVPDLYAAHLRLAQHNEITSSDIALKGIVDYYARQSCVVNTTDIFSLVSDSVPAFNLVLQQTVLPLISKNMFASLNISSSSSQTALTRAYSRLFACKSIRNPTQEDYVAVQNEVSSLYFQILSSSFLTTNIVQDNYGEDIFWNGNPDDSQFDLLVDMQAIGTTFFTTFQAPPQILFYALPQRSSYLDTQQRIAALDVSPVTPPSFPSESSSSGRVTLPYRVPGEKLVAKETASSVLSSPSSSSSSSLSQASSSPALADKDIQHFLSTTNTQLASSSFDFVVGNQCVSGSVFTPALSSLQEAQVSAQEYLSGVDFFLTTIALEDKINDHLLSGFIARYASFSGQFSSQGGASSSAGPSPANDYSQQGFVGSETTDCSAHCSQLPLSDQFACQASCTKSCVRSCDGLPLDQKVLCVNDCACFMVSGPLGSGWKNIENLFSIKFCTQPVQQVYAQRGRTVFSLEGIFAGLSDILRGLKNSGKTTKFTKSKEALDGNILSKFAEAIDFTIRVTFKPLFSQSSQSQLLRARQQDATKLAQSNLGIASDDDYTKYLVLANPAAYKASLEPTNSYEQTQANVQKFATLSALSSSSQNTASLYQQQKYVFLMDDIFSFLKAHQQFWEYSFKAFVDMDSDATTLQQKINQAQ